MSIFQPQNTFFAENCLTIPRGKRILPSFQVCLGPTEQGYGVIGNTSVSGTAIWGSSPYIPTQKKLFGCMVEQLLCLYRQGEGVGFTGHYQFTAPRSYDDSARDAKRPARASLTGRENALVLIYLRRRRAQRPARASRDSVAVAGSGTRAPLLSAVTPARLFAVLVYEEFVTYVSSMTRLVAVNL